MEEKIEEQIAFGIIVWSLFSGLTGFAKDFWTLFFCRVMVGVSEATLGPAAISLYYHKRNSVFWLFFNEKDNRHYRQ